MATKQKPAEPRATVRIGSPFASVEFDGPIRVLVVLGVIFGLLVLFFLLFSPFQGGIINGPTTAPPSPSPGVAPPTTDSQASGSGAGGAGAGGAGSGGAGGTNGAGSSTRGGSVGITNGSGGGDIGSTSDRGGSTGGSGGSDSSNPGPTTLVPHPTPAPPPPVAKGSFLDPFNGQQVSGKKTYSAKGTVEGLSSGLTLLCMVKGVNAPYFFYDTYGNIRGAKGEWGSELEIGPPPPHQRKFTLSLVTATRSAVDEINEYRANVTVYNKEGLSKPPVGIEILDEVVIDRTS